MRTFRQFVLSEGLDVSTLSEVEYNHFKKMRGAYEKLSHYQGRSRNRSTMYAKHKFVEAFKNWDNHVSSVKKECGLERGKYVIDMVMGSFPSSE